MSSSPEDNALKKTKIVNINPTKPLYLIKTKSDVKLFGATKLEKTPNYVEFSGFDLSVLDYVQLEKLKTYDDVITLFENIKEHGFKITSVNLIIPWNEIKYIENVSYKFKNLQLGEK